MHRFGALIVSAGALALASCGHKQSTDNGMATTTTTTSSTAVNEAPIAPEPAPVPGQAFANTAAASDAFEIESSKLAATQGRSSEVKAFARQMISAHGESTSGLKTAASTLSPAVVPSPILTAEQQTALDGLRALKGAEFDKAYVAAQVDAHQKALAALRDYSASGDVPKFKDFATELVPIVTAHLNMAQALKP